VGIRSAFRRRLVVVAANVLPVIPIPLQDPHPDAELDLQAVLHRVYDVAYYRDSIYDGSPWPPLSDADAD